MRFTHENENCVIDNCTAILIISESTSDVAYNMENDNWCYATVHSCVHNPGWWQLAYTFGTTHTINLINKL